MPFINSFSERHLPPFSLLAAGSIASNSWLLKHSELDCKLKSLILFYDSHRGWLSCGTEREPNFSISQHLKDTDCPGSVCLVSSCCEHLLPLLSISPGSAVSLGAGWGGSTAQHTVPQAASLRLSSRFCSAHLGRALMQIIPQLYTGSEAKDYNIQGSSLMPLRV